MREEVEGGRKEWDGKMVEKKRRKVGREGRRKEKRRKSLNLALM